MAFCIALSLSLSLPSPATPLNTVYLSTKTKHETKYESFEPQWHRSLCRVRTRRPTIPIQTMNIQKEEVGCFWCIKANDTRGSACSSHAKSTWIIWNIRQNHRCNHYGRVLTMTIVSILAAVELLLSFEFVQMLFIPMTELFHTNLCRNIYRPKKATAI